MEGVSNYENGLDNLEATELTLALPGIDNAPQKPPSKRNKRGNDGSNEGDSITKVQAVGWPPIRAYRRNSFGSGISEINFPGTYVKVSLDGAPYLRKIDLKMYNGYAELMEALEDMFKCFSLGEFSGMEGGNGSEYAITYEDKEGDWMLVGDVPWGMFIISCKRLRIMKGHEARGLGSNFKPT